MTQIRQIFFDLLSDAINGKPNKMHLSQEEWKEIFVLAYGQQMLPLLFEAARNTQDAALYTALFEKYKGIATAQVVCEVQKHVEFLRLHRCLLDRGLHPVTVKGELCARLYPYEFYRITADADLYLSAQELSSCREALEQCGFSAAENVRDPGDAEETTYRNADGSLLVELHRALFDSGKDAPDDLNIFFANAFDNTVRIGELYAMGPQQHLLYLILHTYKHFIYSGVGVRQVCDIGLWIREYAQQIDWTELREQCAAVHADRFAAALFAIIRDRLRLDVCIPDAWLRIAVDPEPLVQDMLDGGVFGSGSYTRLHTSTFTLDAVRADRRGRKPSFVFAIFPSLRYMSGSFPYLRRYPVLLPFAWAARILEYLLRTEKNAGNSPAESLRLAKRRIGLLREYGIIG